MKRKLISILLLAVVVCTLASCSVKKHETENYSIKVGGGLSMRGLSYEVLILLVRDYSERIEGLEQILCPREGGFTLGSGESFRAQLTDCYFGAYGLNVTYDMSFNLSIYGTDGELICEGLVKSEWGRRTGLNYNVNENLSEYWLAIAVPFSEITVQGNENGGAE